MIVVTTPAGQIGHHVLQHCLRHGDEAVRVVAHKPDDLPAAIRQRVDVKSGSHGVAAVIDEALEGADALFWLLPPKPRSDSVEHDYVDFTRPAASAIRRHGVSRVVTVQAISGGTRWAKTAGLATASQDMVDVLATSGAAVRSLAAPSMMDNMLMQRESIDAQGVFFGAYEAGMRMPQVAACDIGAVAGRLLLDASWSGFETLPVLGPEDLSMDDMAIIMSDVLGKPVRYRQVPYDGFAARLREQGMPDAYAAGMVEMMRAKNAGLDNALPREGAPVTPTSFRQWSEEVLLPAVRARSGRERPTPERVVV